jgi:RNA polymerase sigma-I factor
LLLVLLSKFLGRQHSMRETGASELPVEIQVARIQQGDVRLRNQFITDYQPLVAKITSRFCKRYIDPSKDDEYSVALMAFNEAINQYTRDAGVTFFSFAETVIRRRLIDHLRKENRHRHLVPYSALEFEGEDHCLDNPLEIQQSIERYEQEKLRLDRTQEISEYAEMLGSFGISFRDLAELSPKHQDSRSTMLAIGREIAANEQWMNVLLTKKMLPIKEMAEYFPVSRKTLERNRKYIIAIALVAYGVFPHLQDYLQIRDMAGKEESE